MYKSYFKSLILRQRQFLIIYTIICFCTSILISLLANFNVPDQQYEVGFMNLASFAVLMIIIAMVLPYINFSFNFQKKSVDTYYSLPISKTKLFNIHYFSGLLMIIVIPTCLVILNLLVIKLRFSAVSSEYMIRFILCYLVQVLGVGFLYSLNTWIVNKANNTLDAIILIVAYVILPHVLLLITEFFIAEHLVGITSYDFVSIENFKWLSGSILTMKSLNYFDALSRNEVLSSVIYIEMLVSLFMAVGFYFAGLRTFKKRKGEDSQQISRDFFTYPLMVNVATVLLISSIYITNCSWGQIFMYLMITFLLYLFMHFAINRSTKVTRKLVLKYMAFLVAFSVFGFVSKQTYFFGINLQAFDLEQYDHVGLFYSDHSTDERMRVEYDLNEVALEEQILINEFLEAQRIEAESLKKYATCRVNEDELVITVQLKLIRGKEIDFREYDFCKEELKNIEENELFKKLFYESNKDNI